MDSINTMIHKLTTKIGGKKPENQNYNNAAVVHAKKCITTEQKIISNQSKYQAILGTTAGVR